MDSIGVEVKHAIRIRECYDAMYRMFQIKPRKEFWNPSPNPVSVKRADLSIMQRNPYMVAEKTDGVRQLMIISRYSDHSPYCVLIDRGGKVYEVTMRAPIEAFEDSMFDCEIIRSENHEWCLYVFDTIQYAGVSLLPCNFMKRYELTHQLFHPGTNNSVITYYADTAKKKFTSTLHVHAKTMYPFHLFQTCAQVKSTLKHASDGYIFTPINVPIMIGKHTGLFKFKHAPTVDIIIINDDDNVTMMCNTVDGRLVRMEELLPEMCLQFVYQAELRFMKNIHILVECTLTVNTEYRTRQIVKFQFYRIREDKKHPNTIDTVLSVVDEVTSCITVADIDQCSYESLGNSLDVQLAQPCI